MNCVGATCGIAPILSDQAGRQAETQTPENYLALVAETRRIFCCGSSTTADFRLTCLPQFSTLSCSKPAILVACTMPIMRRPLRTQDVALLPSLPLDVVRQIAQHICDDRNDPLFFGRAESTLLAMACASKSWSAVVLPALYSFLRLEVDGSSTCGTQLFGLLSVLMQTDRARLVRSLEWTVKVCMTISLLSCSSKRLSDTRGLYASNVVSRQRGSQ